MTTKSSPKSILNKKPASTAKLSTAPVTAEQAPAQSAAKKPASASSSKKTTIKSAATANKPAIAVKPNDVIPSKNIYDNPAKVLRVMSINVNGLRASEKKGLLEYLIASEADVVCMQETRITHEQWTDKYRTDGWHCHLFAAERAGYAGTAIYSRLPIVSVSTGLGFELADTQGRFISAEFDLGLGYPVHIASLYLPSGSSGDEAQARKDSFLVDYQAVLAQWRQENRSIIVCGDYNIIHKRIDIKNWSGNQKASGVLPHERAWLDHLYGPLGYVDTFRVVRHDDEIYSWWSNRGQARAKNVGWRIDYHACSPDWRKRTLGAWVYKDTWFSDHAPVIIDYQL